MPDRERDTADTRSTSKLMKAARAELQAPEAIPSWLAYAADEGRRPGPPAIVTLQSLPTKKVLAAGIAALDSADPRRRRVGVLILGELKEPALGIPPAYPGKTIRALTSLARRETDLAVITELARSLGYRSDPRAVPVLLELAAHSDPSVRFFAACSLPMCASPDTLATVTGALISMTRDQASQVRDHALFGLGELQLDTPAVRAAALACSADPDGWVAGQALLHLAVLNDPRAIEPLAVFLRTAKRRPVSAYGYEAAGLLADPSLLTALHSTRPKKAYRSASSQAVEACETSTPAARH